MMVRKILSASRFCALTMFIGIFFSGVRTSDFFRYPEHRSSTSLSNTQKRKNMSHKSKRIQTQLSLLQTNSSFFLKDAQNQAKVFEPQCESFQYRTKRYMLKKRSREEFGTIKYLHNYFIY